MAAFGNKYKKLIDKNPNKKSLFNNDPGLVLNIKSLANPFELLVNEHRLTFTTGSNVELNPIIGRSPSQSTLIDVYYVFDDYIDDDYVEVQQIPG